MNTRSAAVLLALAGAALLTTSLTALAQCDVDTAAQGSNALDAFGRSMATDDYTLVVGIPGYDAPGAANSGALRVYTQGFGNSWTPVALLTEGVAASAGNSMGVSVAIDLQSGPGTIVAGAPIAAVNGLASAGVVRIFQKVNGTWTLSATLPNPLPQSNDQFGATVALDGDELFVGCPGDDAAGVDKGAVYCYRRVGNGWALIDTLTRPAFNSGCRVGEALDVRGRWALLGVPKYATAGHTEQGAVLVYKKDATGHWVYNTTWDAGKPDGSRTGYAVGLGLGWAHYSIPGEQVSATSGVGKVVTYWNDGETDEGNWAMNSPEIATAHDATVTGFGSSIAAYDGGVTVVGATGGNYRAFALGTTEANLVQIPAPAESGNAAGASVAIGPDWSILMGDPMSNVGNMLDAGRVYQHVYNHGEGGSDACHAYTDFLAGAFWNTTTYRGCTTVASPSPIAEMNGLCTNTASSRDLWFKVWTNPTVPITLDTIGSSFDTVLTVYTTCPSGGGTIVACNDDGAGNLMSRIELPAQPWRELLVRVGGYNGAQGAFNLNLTRGCGNSDFNGDGDFGTDADIEAFFACLGGNCPFNAGNADFNSDGDTGTDQDIEAFFRVLGGGNC